MGYGLNKDSVEVAASNFIDYYLMYGVDIIELMQWLDDNDFEVDAEDVYEEVITGLDTALQMYQEREN